MSHFQLTPREYLEHLSAQQKNVQGPIPSHLIVCLHPALVTQAVRSKEWSEAKAFRPALYRSEQNSDIGLTGRWGFGAPAVCFFMDLYIAMGVKSFILIGTAGSLTKSLQAGSHVLTSSSYGQDRFSLHAAKELNCEPRFTASDALTKEFMKLGSFIQAENVSVDSLFLPYQFLQSAWTTDMEAAAVYGLTQLRRREGCEVQSVCLFSISDVYADGQWMPSLFDSAVMQAQQDLLELAFEVCRRRTS